MINLGDYNNLQVVRESEHGYFLNAGTGSTRDDILLPFNSTNGVTVAVGDKLEVFIYRDSKDRLIATLKKPIAKVGELAYLTVVSKSKIGAFIDFGLERDIFVPIKEQKYNLEIGNKYLFYIYIDKTGRIAATTEVDRYLENIVEDVEQGNEAYPIGKEVVGVSYGYQTNGTVMVAVDNKYRGIILKNEFYVDIKLGYELSLRIKKIYEDGRLGLTPRKKASLERVSLEDEIIKYLKKNNGFMKYNDKSSPEEVKAVFKSSKNYFKNALGGLMKKNKIRQDEKGTYLIENGKN